jgi:hypothetical protein
MKKDIKISRLAMMIIFLALIRCICEPFRLAYYSENGLSFEEVKPFLMGALVAAVALALMTILSWYEKSKLVIYLSVVTVILLLVVKGIYLGF